MTKSSLLGHTIEAFMRFLAKPTLPADITIRNFFRERKYLGSTDRRFIGDVYFGAIKHYLRLESIAQDALPTSETQPQLIIAAYCLVFRDDSPAELRNIIAKLAGNIARNYPIAVFEKIADRKYEEERLSTLPAAKRLAIYYSFPQWFVDRLEQEYGASTEPLLRSLNEEAKTNLRINRSVTTREDLQKLLKNAGVNATLSTMAEDALILEKRTNVWDLKPFKDGLFEIQDEASQLVAPFANITSKRVRVLDACAGAGGKTLHFSSLLRGGGEIFATDVDAYKLDEMKKRTVRSNAQNIRIIKPNKYDQYLGAQSFGSFDVVLLDVPCSGTGTLRRNPSIKWNLTNQMHDELIQKQRHILERNAPYVKQGGVLLYSTCSLLKSEGEEQANWFLSLHPEFKLEATRRTHPEQEHCDGFFVARLRRV
jgi:16S rRNA (cytosine(967)-C(5))-methyltransferase